MEVLLYDSTVCRLCAEENSNGILIFPNDGSEPDLSCHINKYLPLKVTDDGKYPCTICPGCNIQMESTMQFLELVIAGQGKLREIFKNQQDELKRIQRENDKLKLQLESGNSTGNDSLSNLVQTIVVQQENDENGETEEILLQILPDGSLFAPDHEQSLRAEGLEKPRRKRGRPPKPPPTGNQETLKEAENAKNIKIANPIQDQYQEDDEFDADGRKRRRRKVPTRFKEAVQGKELERIFREEGVIDENESSEEEDTSPDVEVETVTGVTDGKSEVIGHLENKEGQDLGQLVIVNKHQKGRGRPKGRKRRHRFTCEICGRGFQHYGRFKLHKAYHKGVKFECTACQIRYDSKSDLVAHQKETEHTGEAIVEGLSERTTVSEDISTGKIQCQQCDKTFVTKQSYEVHLKAVHEGQRPFACQLCDKSFAYMASLKGHLVSHEMKTNKGYPCDICGKVLNHPSSVIYHKQSEHNNGRRFVCNKCNKSFKHKQLLQRHQLVHTNQRPFECTSCGARFKAKSNLLNHQLTHTGIRKYFCVQCGQQFAHKTSLTLHYRWHSGQKPYQCVFCEKSFSQNGNLQEHIRIHTGVKPYCCDFCGRKFTTSSQFKLHVKRHTGERPWTCEVCEKTFLNKDTWKCHTRRHLGQRPYTCTTCNRGFTEQWALKKHMRIHTGEKPYVCDICDKAFSDCSNLSKHKKIHANRLAKDNSEMWQNMGSVDAPENTIERDSSVLYKTDNCVNQLFYVSYHDADELEEPRTLHIVDNLGTPIGEETQLLNPNSNEEDPLQLPVGLSTEQLEVTDEDGNSIYYTTPDGLQLRVTTYDGEHLQATEPDGTVVPIEISIENGQTIAVTRSPKKLTVYGEHQTTTDVIDTADESMINDEQALEFLTQDGLKVRLITTKADMDSDYLSVV